MKSRLILVILFVSIVCAGLLTAIALTPAVENVTGQAHPTIPLMRTGGDGQLRLMDIKTYAILFQFLVLINYVLFFMLGISRKKADIQLYLTLFAVFSLTAFIWYKIVSGHQLFQLDQTTEFFLGVPQSTAWMLYGVWGSGMMQILFYCIGFRRYIYSPEDQAEFGSILREFKGKD